jgi:[ribosomal protein S5]-alanine N-acetyltransferase
MQPLRTPRLVLEPLVAAHAPALFELLGEPVLYRYLDFPAPPSVEYLQGVYRQLEARGSPDGSELWLNWVVRPHGQALVGYVQATVEPARNAWVAYVLSSAHWGRGYAIEAVQAMMEHLGAVFPVPRYSATVEAGNARSVRLLERLGFRAVPASDPAAHRLSPSERLFVREATGLLPGVRVSEELP